MGAGEGEQSEWRAALGAGGSLVVRRVSHLTHLTRRAPARGPGVARLDGSKVSKVR